MLATLQELGIMPSFSRPNVKGDNAYSEALFRIVTPTERHTGSDAVTLERRRQVYEQARQKHPERWTGKTRDCTPVATVLTLTARHCSRSDDTWPPVV